MKSRLFPRFDTVVATRLIELGPNTVHDSKTLFFRKKVRKWLEKSCSGDFVIHGASVGFENEWDAIAFKMFVDDGKAWEYMSSKTQERADLNIWTGESIRYGTDFPENCHIHFDRSLFPADYLNKFVSLFVDVIAGDLHWPWNEESQARLSKRDQPPVTLSRDLPAAWTRGHFVITVGSDMDHVIKVYDRHHLFPKKLSSTIKDD